MNSTRLFLAASVALAVACGSSADPAAAGAATAAISAALGTALASGSGTSITPRGGSDNPLRDALVSMGRSGNATSFSCTGGCGTATSGSKTAACTMTATPLACQGGGTVQGSGTVNYTFNCA